jgi:hypothetical protein
MAQNVTNLTGAIEEMSHKYPELFSQQTTDPLVEQAQAWGANRTLGGGNDLENLEGFVAQPERFGREQEGVLQALANREGAEGRAAAARARRARKADVDAGTFERQTRGRGLNERQQKASTRRLGLSRSLAIADAGSGSRRSTTALAIGARKAGAALENQLFGQEIAGLTSLANAEGQRQVRAAQEKAARKAASDSTTGMAVGGILSIASLLSSEDYKDKRGSEDNILGKLRKVRIDRWNYKGDDAEHIGPYSEEFNDTFGVGQKQRDRINLVDYLGVTLGAIKELNEKVEAHG